jgi:hypothetical protein
MREREREVPPTKSLEAIPLQQMRKFGGRREVYDKLGLGPTSLLSAAIRYQREREREREREERGYAEENRKIKLSFYLFGRL